MGSTKFIVSRKSNENNGTINQNTKFSITKKITKKEILCRKFTFDLPLMLSLYKNETSQETPFQKIKCIYNEKYPDLPTLERQHYLFEGYSKTQNGDLITKNDIVQYFQTNLYAVWTPASTINFDYTTNGGTSIQGSTTEEYYKGHKLRFLPRPEHPTLNFSGWYTSPTGGTKITAETIFYQELSGSTLYAQYSNQSYSIINLNTDGWRLSSDTNLNPDPVMFDGCYESFRNCYVDTGCDFMKIKFSGYSTFNLYIRSCGEDACDYVQCIEPVSTSEQHSDLDYFMELMENSATNGNIFYCYADGESAFAWELYDQDWNHLEDGTVELGMKEFMNHNLDTTINGYTLASYENLDPLKEYVITVIYGKDGSSNLYDDKGYLLIPYSNAV